MVFDRNNRWHDERGRFASIPPSVTAPAPPDVWEVEWVFSVRGFDEPRVSPPREDTAKWTFEGSKPTSGELFLAWQEIEAGYRDQRIYAFNESIPVVTLVS